VRIARVWQCLVLSGRAVPLDAPSSDAAMIQRVAQSAGAIGYVSSYAALPDSVKAVSLSD